MADPRGLNVKCTTEELEVIQEDENLFNIFIQLDKPVYKPLETVRYRIIVIGKDLLPYYLNSICVEIFDSLNHLEYQKNDTGADGNIFSGATKFLFFDIRRIKVTVDNIRGLISEKKFSVQDYTLPLFDAYINIWEQHLLLNSSLEMSIYAKYPFNEYVHGYAELVIKALKYDKIIFTKNLLDITETHYFKYSIRDLVGSLRSSKLDYEVTVIFTEAETGSTATKTDIFSVYLNNDPRIQAIHPEKFVTGLPFSIKVYIFDWKGDLTTKSYDKVIATLECQLQTGSKKELVEESEIKNGVSIHNFIIPEYAVGVKIKVEYQTVSYEKLLERGNNTYGVSTLMVEHFPKKYG